MDVRYTRCLGTELFTEDGRRILDFLSGYCVHNAGHNHPDIIAELKDELDQQGPAMLQSHVPELAGELASELCRRAGGRLSKVFFASSGSEGVEAAIKFSRAHTGRAGLLSAEGAFHGLTCGSLSLMSDPFWRDGFGPMLPDVEMAPFADLEALEKKLATRRFAAYIVEPMQGEAGIRVPEPEYLQSAQALCRRYKTLFVLDEVQTGIHRTGPFLAAHHYGLDPDMVVLAKALSGGLVPVSAVLLTDWRVRLGVQFAETVDCAHLHFQRERSLDAGRAGHASCSSIANDWGSGRRRWVNCCERRCVRRWQATRW